MIKKLSILGIFISCFVAQTQVQNNAPWTTNLQAKGKKAQELSIFEIEQSAREFFKTLDVDSKGSGIKPFERWNYHWSFYTDENGVIKSPEKLWEAWEAKNNQQFSGKNDVSNWQSIGPISHTNTASWSSGQGRVNTIAIDPNDDNTYYAGAPAGGIWKSSDAGQSWAPLVDYLPQIGVSGIAIDPTNSDIIYIATGDDDSSDSYAVGVWKTTDGGSSWSEAGNINANSMNEIYIFPNNTQNVMVATSGGIYKTTNGGNSWSLVANGNFIDLKMKPGDSSTWYAATSNTVYKSTDSGNSFSVVSISSLTGSGRLVLDVTPADPNYVYVLSSKTGANQYAFNGIWRSTDSGSNFIKMAESNNILESTQAWFDLALGVSDTNPNVLFVGCLNVWRSTNGGDNFQKINEWNAPTSPTYTHADIHFLRYHKGKLLAGTDGGFYQSTNNGSSFTDLTGNMAISQFYKISVAVQNSENVVGGLQDNGGYAFSDNRWNNYFGADGMDCAVDQTSEKVYHGFIQYGGALFSTTDGGLTRNSGAGAPDAETSPGDSGGEWVTPLVSDSQGNLYAGYKKLYKLVNGAWEATGSFELFDDIDHIDINPKDDNHIFMSEKHNLYMSLDGGVNFTTLPFNQNSLNTEIINAIEVSPKDSNTIWIVTNNSVYTSTNILSNNPTFSKVGSSSLPSEGKFTIKYHERSGNNTLYLGTALGVYYYSDDSNSRWMAFDNNLPNVAVRDLEINEKDFKLYAGTYGRGVFVTNIPRVLPPKDISVVRFPNLEGISCDNNFAPAIEVKNDGSEALTNFVINFDYDDGVIENYNWTGTINPGETKTIPFSNKVFTVGTHKLNVTVDLNDDDYVVNNNLSQTFKVNSGVTSPLFVYSFDTNSDDDILLSETLGVENNIWETGSLSRNGVLTSSSNVYATILRGNYPNNAKAYLYSSCYDLTQVSDPKIVFKMGFDIEKDWDYLIFEYSIDGGNSWSILGDANSPNWYNSSATTDETFSSTLPGKQWTGEGELIDTNSGTTNATLKEYSHDLSFLSTETSVIFRFALITDQEVNEEGVIIDDFGLQGSALSIDDVSLTDNFNVYPNPSKGIFNISWNTDEDIEIEVYNYLGKRIVKSKQTNDNVYQIDLSNQSKGIYLIKINTSGKQVIKKVVLQ